MCACQLARLMIRSVMSFRLYGGRLAAIFFFSAGFFFFAGAALYFNGAGLFLDFLGTSSSNSQSTSDVTKSSLLESDILKLKSLARSLLSLNMADFFASNGELSL